MRWTIFFSLIILFIELLDPTTSFVRASAQVPEKATASAEMISVSHQCTEFVRFKIFVFVSQVPMRVAEIYHLPEIYPRRIDRPPISA